MPAKRCCWKWCGWRAELRRVGKAKRAHHLACVDETWWARAALCPPYGPSAVPNINPTPNNRHTSCPSSPCPAAFSRYLWGRECHDVHGARIIHHEHESPPSHRSIRRRRRRRAGDVARCRARGAACLGAWPRRHAIWRPPRQSRRSDQKSATRDRRSHARASAAGAAAGRLSHRHAAPRKRHTTGRRARRDQTRVQRRRLDAAG